MTSSTSSSLSSCIHFFTSKLAPPKIETGLTDATLSSPTSSSITNSPTADTELDEVELGDSFDKKTESDSSTSTIGSFSPERKEYDEDYDDVHEVENNCVDDKVKRICQSFFTENIFPDDRISVWGYQIFDSIQAVRLFKFLFLTISLILEMHLLSRYLGWEHDPSYTIMQFLKDDLNHVIMDSASFFLIGRLYQRKGVDRLLPFILPMIISSAFASWSTTDIWFFQNSITWYNLLHVWPWQLYLFAAICVSLLILVLGLHIRSSFRDGTLLYRSVEGVFITLMFIAPHISDSNLHLHHWYSFWLFGVLCNRDEWWSQLAMGLSWGVYLNGVSVYGRDGLYDSK